MSGHPYIGQLVYGEKNCERPFLVAGIEGTGLILVPLGTPLHRTHKGNVYNEHGEGEWQE